MMKATRPLAFAALFAALAACGGAEEEMPEATVGAEPAAAPAAGMQGMEGMQMDGGMKGMAGMQMDGGMMAQMQSHMQRMEGASSDSAMAMMPMHRQMTANMIAQMNREMRDMNMAADAEWTETVDALRQDLKRMPELTAAELRALMPEHRARLMRLMDLHRTMMAGMAM